MPSFSDSIFLFVLALLLFGPKRLPVLARELGKWVGEFRRASNEFKMQMNEELRLSEQADRQKEIAAMQAAAPVAPAVSDSFREAVSEEPLALESATASPAAESFPLPIATSGELSLMPPSTGLPEQRMPPMRANALDGLLGNIPVAEPQDVPPVHTEVPAHAD